MKKVLLIPIIAFLVAIMAPPPADANSCRDGTCLGSPGFPAQIVSTDFKPCDLNINLNYIHQLASTYSTGQTAQMNCGIGAYDDRTTIIPSGTALYDKRDQSSVLQV